MNIAFSFANHRLDVSLFGNPTARDLLQQLPLDVEIEDFSTNEKIVHLPRKLTERNQESYADPAVGDVCYYAPWGNLAFFYKPYRYSPDLIRVGKLLGGVEPLMTRGRFPLRVEILT